MTLKNFIQCEGWTLKNKRQCFFILIFIFVVIYLILSSISQYNSIIRKSEDFKKFERKKDKEFGSWIQYVSYGIRFFYVPPSFMAFYNGGPVPDNMTGYVDTSERIRTYNSFDSQRELKGFMSDLKNFTGFILIFGCLFIAVYGFIGFYNHQWLQFRASQIGSRWKLFIKLLITRLINVFLFCLFLLFLCLFLLVVTGTSVNIGMSLFYFMHVFNYLAISLFIGIICAVLKKFYVGCAVLLAAWFIMSFVFPTVATELANRQADKIKSSFQRELIKLEILMNFEKEGLRAIGKIDKSIMASEMVKKFFQKFWENDYKVMMNEDKEAIEELEKRVSHYQNISALFPSTFFHTLSNEMSGRGFAALIKFKKYIIMMKKAFVYHYASNVIFKKQDEIIPFIKGDENIFNGEISLPPNYGTGLTITYLWLFALIGIAMFKYDQLFKVKPDTNNGEYAKVDPKELESGKTLLLSPLDQRTWDDFMLNIRRNEIRHVLLFDHGCLPGNYKVKWIFKMFGLNVTEELKKVEDKYTHNNKELSNEKKVMVEMEIVNDRIKRFQDNGEEVIVVINNILQGLDDSFFLYFLMWLELIKKGNKVVYFSNSYFFPEKFADEWIPTRDILKNGS